jgi:hypothetical protein
MRFYTQSADAAHEQYHKYRDRSLRALLDQQLNRYGGEGMLAVRPPDLVRGAIEHEYHERSLCGSSIDMQSPLQHLGIGPSKAVLGFPQLMRPCDINGHLVYHLTTFFRERQHGHRVRLRLADPP